MILVTFHGGSSGIDTIVGYDDDGGGENTNVLSGAHGLSELRGFAFVPGSLLWVVSGSKKHSCIACFDASTLPYSYIGPIASYPDVDSLLHPFDLTFDDVGHCFVSNQNTNVVARLTVGADYRSASPATVASVLPGDGSFWAGTFVASANGNLPGLKPTTPVPVDAGLAVCATKTKVTHSVRGVLSVNDLLYVADEVANCVKVYDQDGALQGKSSPVTGPVHLVLWEGTLYTGSGDQVLYATLAANQFSPQFTPVPNLPIASVSGMCFDGAGNFYAGSRKRNVVWKCSGFTPANGPTSTMSWQVPDNPEFVLHVDA